MSVKKRALVYDNNLGLIKTTSDYVVDGFVGVWKTNTVYSKDDIVIIYGQSNIGYKSFLYDHRNYQVEE